MKSIKVFWNGKRLKDIYPHATRWQVFKYRVRKFIRNLIKWSILIGIVIGAFQLARTQFPKTIYVQEVVKQTEYIKADDDLQAKIIELKSEVLDKLKQCESGNLSEDTGLIVFDSNKVASIGLYQFQKDTVIYYYKKLYGKEITGKQAIEIALDEKKSRQLAEDIIFGDSKGVDNWLNCKNKNGLAENIRWINKISQ